jgi:membrane associated rhomboid family serine protease
MTPTSVGMRCPECARERTRVYRAQSIGGTPIATQALIAINVLAYLAEIATGAGFGNVQSGTVYDHGALYGPAVGIGHDYWRLVTSGFLHASFFHIAFNMYFIWIIGRSLEPAIGSARFVALYLASLLCGSLGVIVLDPNSVAVGASGAAFGLLGAVIVEARSRGIDLWQSGLLPLALINFAFTFLFPGIAVGAHVGGFVGGLAIGMLFLEADRRRVPRPVSLAACVAIAAAAGIAAAALA